MALESTPPEPQGAPLHHRLSYQDDLGSIHSYSDHRTPDSLVAECPRCDLSAARSAQSRRRKNTSSTSGHGSNATMESVSPAVQPLPRWMKKAKSGNSKNWVGSPHMSLSAKAIDSGPLVTLDINVCSSRFRPDTSTSNQGKQPMGNYYMDGGGARLPAVKKRKLTFGSLGSALRGMTTSDFSEYSFPELADAPPAKNRVDDEVYGSILAAYEDYCTANTIFHPRFQNSQFPSVASIDTMVELCITHLHPLLPMLHLATLDLNQRHWVLTLAMATFGSHFIEHPQSIQLVMAMQEFLRRVVVTLSNLDMRAQTKLDQLCLIQANLLSSICGVYSGNPRLRRNVYNARSALCAFCIESWAIPEFIEEDRPDGHDATFWYQWTFNESVRRTGYAIWLLESMLVYQMDWPPILTLEHAKVPLPCPEILFEAESAEEWIVLSRLATPMPSLITATELLYTQKHVSISFMGEYSRVLLLHAVLQRTWDVERYLRQPMSLHVDNAGQSRICDSTSADRWHQGTPILEGWQHAAKDCFEVLHRDALACAAAQSKEHPTILHLHLARIVLCTPFGSISRLAFHLAGVQPFTSQTEEASVKEKVLYWIQHKQRDARLSIIHAGHLFWHIRRFSASGFYEPSATFLATLILWAYTTCMHHMPQEEQIPYTGYPAVINLDRPLDDELAQTFVNQGASMSAFITGVGNLSDPSSPLRVVEHGGRLLRTLTTWGYSWQYMDVLSGLAKQGSTL